MKVERTLKSDVISLREIKKEGLELICNFEGILLYGKDQERYYLRRLLAYRNSYFVIFYHVEEERGERE